MDKREFLKTSGVIVAGSMLSKLSSGQQQPAPRENWAGNITYSTDHVFTPASIVEVQGVVEAMRETSCTRVPSLVQHHRRQHSESDLPGSS